MKNSVSRNNGVIGTVSGSRLANRTGAYLRATAALAVIGSLVLSSGCAPRANAAAETARSGSAWTTSDASQGSTPYLPAQLANAAPDSDRYNSPAPTF